MSGSYFPSVCSGVPSLVCQGIALCVFRVYVQHCAYMIGSASQSSQAPAGISSLVLKSRGKIAPTGAASGVFASQSGQLLCYSCFQFRPLLIRNDTARLGENIDSTFQPALLVFMYPSIGNRSSCFHWKPHQDFVLIPKLKRIPLHKSDQLRSHGELSYFCKLLFEVWSLTHLRLVV